MSTATFRFYAELNDFLPPEKRQRPFIHRFYGRVSVKDVIQAIGVPHTEVDLILVNGESADFGYLVRDGDRVSVYPVFETLDISSLLKVRPEPLRETRFVADGHLGRLAAYLRMLGFDTLYRNDFTDEALAELSSCHGRILLTRDRGLLKRTQVSHGYYVRATNPQLQLAEVLTRFDLAQAIRPFQRCIKCNSSLQLRRKEEISERLPPKVRQYYDEFYVCRNCGQVFWKGAHYRRMQELIDALLKRDCGCTSSTASSHPTNGYQPDPTV